MKSKTLEIALPILVSLIVVHILVMYSIRPYGYNFSAMIRLTETEEAGEKVERYFQKGMVIFTHGGGYDGQNYYYVAMDSLSDMNYKNAYRQQRMLYPLFARILALDKKSLLPYTLYAANMLALSLGMYFFILLLRQYSASPWWSLFYGLSPSTIMTIQYDLPSPVSISLIIAAICFYTNKKIILTTIFMSLAFLAREDSIMVLMPLLIWDYQNSRRFKRIALLSACLMPFFLWQIFVTAKLGNTPVATSAETISFIPFSGIVGYLKTIELDNFKHIGRQLSAIIVFLYFIGISAIIAKKLMRKQHLFYYAVAAYCLLSVFTVPSQWDNYNGLLRMFYGLFPFLILSYCLEKDKLIKGGVYFMGILSFLTVVRILFISPVYPFRIW